MPKKIKKKKTDTRKAIDLNKDKSLQLLKYEITYDPIDSDPYPPELEDELSKTHDLIHKSPKKAIPRIKKLIKEYSNLKMLYNWLSAAYSAIGENKKAENTVCENYKNNPDYLFAKLNYAEICLSKGNHKEVPKIFNEKYDLKLLYPEKTVFHVTEVIGFFSVLCKYFIKIYDIESANKYYEVLEKVDPEHPFTEDVGFLLKTVQLFNVNGDMERLINKGSK